MKFDPRTNFLYVAGGASGGGNIYDADSGAEIAFYQFLPPGVKVSTMSSSLATPLTSPTARAPISGA